LQQLMQARRGELPPALAARRTELLARGWAQLQAGDNDAALASFDEAALMLHAADTELALVRTYLQRGEYQRAISFGAHTAGAHREVSEAAVLYAWLLQLGGHGDFAVRMLDEALQRRPGDELLAEARASLQVQPLQAGPVARQAELRLGPLVLGPQPPAAARVLATATLVAEEGLALAPLAVLGDRPALWLRDGLGRTASATAVQALTDLGLVLLRAPGLAGRGALPWAERDGFAGSPAQVLDHLAGGPDLAAWPQQQLGFLGPWGADKRPLLGMALPAGPRGGPVLDRQGRLVGVALAHADGRDRLVPVSALRAALGLSGPAAGSGDHLGAGPAYELALPFTLQLLAA
jgi:tetratricopeptide (TPR) repeat protein